MQYRVGVKHYDAGHYEQAVRWFFDSAKGGQRDAQVNLAKMLEGGRGVKEPDEVTAFKWYYEAAKRGDRDAMCAVGRMYAQGSGGVTKDMEKAQEYYRNARELGSEEARMWFAEQEKMNGCLCKMLGLVRFLLVTAAILGLAVIIAIVVFLVKADVISF